MSPMFHSVFQIFKVGVGPSSSHTMGPMTAAMRFRGLALEAEGLTGDDEIVSVRCILRGSLAFTGRGHAADRAVCLGLLGFTPEDIDPDAAQAAIEKLFTAHRIVLENGTEIIFDPEKDIIFDFDSTELAHPNSLTFEGLCKNGQVVLAESYCSIGGGFVVTEAEQIGGLEDVSALVGPDVPFPFSTMAELLDICSRENLSIAQLARRNELASIEEGELDEKLDRILTVMNSCMDRGLKTVGELPGGLHVKRRAAKIWEKLIEERRLNELKFQQSNDWLCAYAMAVNEENAAGNQVVTAPTNGAAGVVPAVIRYYVEQLSMTPPPGEQLRDFLLVAGVVGSIIKQRASISGAEVGCQGEVGSASAMAAAGLCAVLGGTNNQIENAAEIALEHHLGLTCDPVNGLVQVPCIERNGFGAIKAVAAASLALHGDGAHFMPLDNCIDAMRETGIEMSAKYKETSQGGLAVNLPEC